MEGHGESRGCSVAGLIRVTARRGTPARAGRRFGPVAIELTREEVTPLQFVQMVDDTNLLVEVEVDGVFATVTSALVDSIRPLATATVGMSAGEVRNYLEAYREVPSILAGADGHAGIRAALLGGAAVASTFAPPPGAGAGADHPASHPGEPIPQFTADPNPTLPVAGGTSDAGVEVDAQAIKDTMIQSPGGSAVLPESTRAPAGNTVDAPVVDTAGTETGPAPVSGIAADGAPVSGEASTAADPVPAAVADREAPVTPASAKRERKPRADRD